MMTTDPLVSVVMGVYNERDSIDSSVKSVLNQTYDNFEFIIVDDGSTDGTASRFRSYDDDRIQVLENESNRGLPYSLNRGIEAASGDYVARMDADERSRPGRFERQLEAITEHRDVHVVGSWYAVVGRNGENVTTVKVSNDRAFSSEDLIENGPGIAHGSTMIRKRSLDRVGGYREQFELAQDLDLWLRMAEQFGPNFVHVVPSVLYERKISVAQMEKRPKQRFFSAIAEECSRRRRRGEPKHLDELVLKAGDIAGHEYTGKTRESMYEYLAGTKLLQAGDTARARRRFCSAIASDVTNVRPWYKLFLTMVPESVRSRVIQFTQRPLSH